MKRPPIIIDKSFLQGTTPEGMKQLCVDCEVLLPDVLLVELFLSKSHIRAECFRKLRHDRGVLTIVIGLPDLLKFEVVNQAPCTPLDDKSLIVKATLRESLFDSTGSLTQEQMQYLNVKEADLRAETLSTIDIWRTVAQFFPRLSGICPGGDHGPVEEARRVIANDRDAIRQIYGCIRQEWTVPNGFPGKLPLENVIGPNWAIYRLVQVHLLAAIDVVSKYAPTVIPNADKRTNERHDLDYTVTAALVGGLATKDRIMAERFRLLCPGSLVMN